MSAGAIAALLAVSLAWGHGAGRDEVDAGENNFNVIASQVQGGSPSSHEPAATWGTTYSYEPACARGEGIRGDGFFGCGDQASCPGGEFYYLWAHYPDGTSMNLGPRCLRPSEAPDVVPLTQADVLRAFRRIPVPASEVVVQPPGGETLVNLDTVFSTRADRFTRTVGLLGREVELEIWPTSFRWVNGDGTEQTTDWPGETWVHGAAVSDLITHRYQHADRSLVARVDTTWTARYRVNGGEWRDVGGTVTISGEPYDLAVRSASPALTG